MLVRRIDKPLVDFIRDDDDVMLTTQFCYHFQLFKRHHLRHIKFTIKHTRLYILTSLQYVLATERPTLID